MKTKTTSLLIAAFVGFLAGCAVMCLVLSRGMAPAKTFASGSIAPAKHAQIQTENVQKLPTPDSSQPAASRETDRRRVLSEIRRNKVASVDVPFFTSSGFQASDGILSQQFIDFFELTPAQAGELSDLVKKAKDEMWNAEKAQAQVSQTDTGGVVIKIPPVTAGLDIYDDLMGGFWTVLGDERYNDMMSYNDTTDQGRQFENLFNEFGVQSRTITIEKNSDGSYKISASIVGKPGTVSTGYTIPSLTLDELKKRNPELLEFIPTE